MRNRQKPLNSKWIYNDFLLLLSLVLAIMAVLLFASFPSIVTNLTNQLQSLPWWILGISFSILFLVAIRFRYLLRPKLWGNAVSSRSLRNDDPSTAINNEFDQISEADTQSWDSSNDPIVLERVEIKNFKSINYLDLCLTLESSLIGNWTCIAGINGAGKSAILQAIALVLLGADDAVEIGSGYLRRIPRRENKKTSPANIRAIVSRGILKRTIQLKITEDGIERSRNSESHSAIMHSTWKSLRKTMITSYGATRNVTDVDKSKLDRFRFRVHRQMSLFDPATQLRGLEILLSRSVESRAPLMTLQALIDTLLKSHNLSCTVEKNKPIRFFSRGASLDIVDLPDGFRSTIVWLADMCMAWYESSGNFGSWKPDDIHGIVLLDEVDLHLHTKLQRSLISSLRKAIPNVQFIATTHSPMMLSSFDYKEIVVLDNKIEGGTRSLRKQIYGLSMNKVFEELMETDPSSGVLDELERAGSDSELLEFLYRPEDDASPLSTEERLEARLKRIRHYQDSRSR